MTTIHACTAWGEEGESYWSRMRDNPAPPPIIQPDLYREDNEDPFAHTGRHGNDESVATPETKPLKNEYTSYIQWMKDLVWGVIFTNIDHVYSPFPSEPTRSTVYDLYKRGIM
jgi:hypothetical protein